MPENEESGAALSGFTAEWLSLREPYDAAARNRDLLQALQDWRPAGRIAVVDLGAGSGANFRALAPWLGGDQDWRLIDRDAALLARAMALIADWAQSRGMTVASGADGLALGTAEGLIRLRTECRDLAAPDTLAALGPADLITASALFDLVSAEWAERLALACRMAGAALFAALSVDGRVTFDPPDPDDAVVLAAFERHQRGDKGFGPALGPGAAPCLAAALARHGYGVAFGPSDWRLDPADHAIRHELLNGIAQAATEAIPAEREAIAAWTARRRGDDGGRTGVGEWSLGIGHTDLFAWLPARKG